MTTHDAQVTDPATLALSHLARAAEHGDDATSARNLDTPEGHRLAGRFREEERIAMQRAKVLAAISQAEHLARIAAAAERIALAL
jgi:hypothetical protein